METIRELNLRLDRVTIENLDWEKCISTYDRSETFFFIDPPYTHCSATLYDGWSIADVQRLATKLSGLKGKWVVTLNDHPDIRRIFSGCRQQAIKRPKGIGGGGKEYGEVILSP